MNRKKIIIILITSIVGTFFIFSFLNGFYSQWVMSSAAGRTFYHSYGWPLTYKTTMTNSVTDFSYFSLIINFLLYFILLFIIMYYLVRRNIKNTSANENIGQVIFIISYFVFLIIIIALPKIFNVIETIFSISGYYDYELRVLPLFILLNILYLGYYLVSSTGSRNCLKYLIAFILSLVCIVSVGSYLIVYFNASDFVVKNYCEIIKDGKFQCSYGWGKRCYCESKMEGGGKICSNSSQCSSKCLIDNQSQLDYINKNTKLDLKFGSGKYCGASESIILLQNLSGLQGHCQSFQIGNFGWEWEINNGVANFISGPCYYE